MSRKEDVNKLQLLVYELDVESAMTKKVVSVSPELSMDKLREVFRANRISGVPVTKSGRLVGIVSLEDYIKWLADDGSPRKIGDVMTKKVETVYSDEPLVHVVGRLEGHGYGRLPVLNRKTGELSGIVTKGDVIESLLMNLEIDYQEEEIRNYRTSRFFEEIIADTTQLNFVYEIKGRSIAEGGEVASSLKKTLKHLGIHPTVVRRAAIAMYEAEMNVIIYARKGKVQVSIDPTHIYLTVEDEGPGIPDVQAAMTPGFSTASEQVRELGFGAGMGLPNIKNNAETLKVSSVVGEGTKIEASFDMERECA
jgi:CBS domain-containing protein/anti-sigma regulatory factor (Ser/Thr protein kinase)